MEGRLSRGLLWKLLAALLLAIGSVHARLDPVAAVAAANGSNDTLLTGGRKLQTVVDTRTIVPTTTAYPYQAIGIIFIDNALPSAGICTGTLVASNFVLTAAHCVWHVDTGKWATTIDFVPAYNPSSLTPKPYGTAKGLSWTVLKAFTQCPLGYTVSCNQPVDFALVKIDRSFTMWMSYGYNNWLTGNNVINTAGYPADKGNCANTISVNSESPSCSMYFSTCVDFPYSSSAKVANVPCMIYGGQSGSPVWLYFSSTNTRVITGVLTSGNPQVGETFTIITQSVFTELQAWQKQSSSG